MLVKFDLEMVLSQAKGGDPQGYLREAAANYRSDCHRSCILSVYNAVFLDIYTKLEHLVEVNRKDRQIFDRARHLKNAHAPYEFNLAEELSKAELITAEQTEYLEALRTQRNEAAHPLGGDWPATKAAYFLTEAVRLFLAQESLSPNMVMAEIIGRLKGENCFPQGNRSSQRAIVAMEIGRLIPAAYHLLLKELSTSWNACDLVFRTNIGIFVREALTLKHADLERAILRQFVVPLLNRLDPKDVSFIISAILLTPSWLRNLDPIPQDRMARLLNEYVKTEPSFKGIRLFLRIHSSCPSLFDGALKEVLRPILASNATDPRLIMALTKRSAAREELLLQYRLQALGRGRAEMLDFMQQHRASIVAHLSGLESYILLLATSEGEHLGRGDPHGVSGLLFLKAAEWFEFGREAASGEARRAGVYDPALWFSNAASRAEGEPISAMAG